MDAVTYDISGITYLPEGMKDFCELAASPEDEEITEHNTQRKQAVFDAFADKSTIAEETMELDETSFGEIMREEAARIAAKRQGEQPETTEVKSNEAE